MESCLDWGETLINLEFSVRDQLVQARRNHDQVRPSVTINCSCSPIWVFQELAQANQCVWEHDCHAQIGRQVFTHGLQLLPLFEGVHLGAFRNAVT